MRCGALELPKVGLHIKGRVGSFRPIDDKPALTLSFDKFTPGQRFYGLRKVYLNNSVEDPTYLNEALGSELFRAAGVPAPRVGLAKVELNGRPLGLYVLKEGFAEEFLALYFRDPKGNLYDNDTGHDVDERLAKHNAGKGARYTRGRGPVSLLHTERKSSQGAALRREAAIKALPRTQKLALAGGSA